MKRLHFTERDLEFLRAVYFLDGIGEPVGPAKLARVLEVARVTAMKAMRRLEAKGYVRTHREGRSNVYTSSVRHGTVVREVVDDFVDRLFDGRALPLVQHLIEDQGLTDAEIDLLQATLGKLKEKTS